MADIDPRDYQGIDATIKNVVRSIRNQLAMFIFSYQEVLLLIKDLESKGLLSEGRIKIDDAISTDENYKAFIDAIVADPDIEKLNAESAATQFAMQTKTLTGQTDTLRQKAKNNLNNYNVRRLIEEYLAQFLDQLSSMGVQNDWWDDLDKTIKAHVIKLIFGRTFSQQAIARNFDDVFNDIQKIANEKYADDEEDKEASKSTGEKEAGEEADEEGEEEASSETADPNYDNEKILKAIEPLVKRFRGLKESKSIFEESSDIKTLAKNAFERWTNSLLTTKFRELFDFLNRFIKMIRLINVPLSNESERKDVYKWLQYVMGRSTEKLEINGVQSEDFKTFYNAFKKYNKELQDRYNEFKRTKPNLDNPEDIIIPEGRITREKVLKEMKIRIKESARMRNLPQGPLSQDLVARLASIDNEFLDYYRRFLTIYNKMRELPDNVKTDSNTDQLAIDFVTNLFADLNQPLSEEDMPIPKWRDIDERYELLYAELQNLIDLEDNFDEAKAKENINFFKREYQKFLTMLSSIAQSGKIGDQTLKLNEVKRLIIQELKVLNGKKMVRN